MNKQDLPEEAKKSIFVFGYGNESDEATEERVEDVIDQVAQKVSDEEACERRRKEVQKISAAGNGGFQEAAMDYEEAEGMSKSGGEGSRGGKIIGHTGGGRPIYESQKQAAHHREKEKHHSSKAEEAHKDWKKLRESGVDRKHIDVQIARKRGEHHGAMMDHHNWKVAHHTMSPEILKDNKHLGSNVEEAKKRAHNEATVAEGKAKQHKMELDALESDKKTRTKRDQPLVKKSAVETLGEYVLEKATPPGGKTPGGYTVKMKGGKRTYVKEGKKKSKLGSGVQTQAGTPKQKYEIGDRVSVDGMPGTVQIYRGYDDYVGQHRVKVRLDHGPVLTFSESSLDKESGGSGSKSPEDIADYIMREKPTNHELTSKYGLSTKTADFINRSSAQYFGPGGKGYNKYVKFVSNALKKESPKKKSGEGSFSVKTLNPGGTDTEERGIKRNATGYTAVNGPTVKLFNNLSSAKKFMSKMGYDEHGEPLEAKKSMTGIDMIQDYLAKAEKPAFKDWLMGIFNKKEDTKKSFDAIVEFPDEILEKAGPFIGPRGGKWADAKHTIPWDDKRAQSGKGQKKAKEHDPAMARELALVTENESQLYNQIQSIQKNLVNKMASGKYDHAQAAKLWQYATDNAAKLYEKQYMGTGQKIPPADRAAAARELSDQFHDMAKDGEFDDMLNKKNAKATGGTIKGKSGYGPADEAGVSAAAQRRSEQALGKDAVPLMQKYGISKNEADALNADPNKDDKIDKLNALPKEKGSPYPNQDKVDAILAEGGKKEGGESGGTSLKGKDFNAATDTWFDTVSESPGDTKTLEKPMNGAPTKTNLGKIKTVLQGSSVPWKGQVLAHIDAIESGQFKGEFKKVEGKTSQISEFQSMLKQAINYNKSLGGIESLGEYILEKGEYFEKAKYIKRTGTPGKYKYEYSKEGGHEVSQGKFTEKDIEHLKEQASFREELAKQYQAKAYSAFNGSTLTANVKEWKKPMTFTKKEDGEWHSPSANSSLSNRGIGKLMAIAEGMEGATHKLLDPKGKEYEELESEEVPASEVYAIGSSKKQSGGESGVKFYNAKGKEISEAESKAISSSLRYTKEGKSVKHDYGSGSGGESGGGKYEYGSSVKVNRKVREEVQAKGPVYGNPTVLDQKEGKVQLSFQRDPSGGRTLNKWVDIADIETKKSLGGVMSLEEYLEKAMPSGESKLNQGHGDNKNPNGGSLESTPKPGTEGAKGGSDAAGAPSVSEKKLSEDDETVSEQLKDGKPGMVEQKVAQKSMAGSNYTRQELEHTIARDKAAWAANLRKGEDDVEVGVGIAPQKVEQEQNLEKASYHVQGSEARVLYSNQSDLEVERLMKSDFYQGGEPTLGYNPAQIAQRKSCGECGEVMAKSLSACPTCGAGSVHPTFELSKSEAEAPVRNGPLLRPARPESDVYIPNSIVIDEE